LFGIIALWAVGDFSFCIVGTDSFRQLTDRNDKGILGYLQCEIFKTCPALAGLTNFQIIKLYHFQISKLALTPYQKHINLILT
jgi:hypothetical protein